MKDVNRCDGIGACSRVIWASRKVMEPFSETENIRAGAQSVSREKEMISIMSNMVSKSHDIQIVRCLIGRKFRTQMQGTEIT